MGFTNFPNGITSFGIPIYGGGGLLGLGVGNVKYLVTSRASTNLYYEKLRTNGISGDDIFITLQTAFDACTSGQNDVIAVTPGAHAVTAELAWNKNNTHMIGLAGPNTASDYSEASTSIYTVTTEVGNTVNLTGNHCQFYNIGFCNAGANAANESAMLVNGYGNYFENCSFIGNMQAQQLADKECCSLEIYTNAHNCHWVNCQIGEDCWGARSAADSGQLKFTGSQPNGGIMKDCTFKSYSDTATCAMVQVIGEAGSTHIGRGWFFDNCKFNNYSGASTAGTECNEVFHAEDAAAYWPLQLHNCSAFGYDEWSDTDGVVIRGTMPQANDGGGIWIALVDDEA